MRRRKTRKNFKMNVNEVTTKNEFNESTTSSESGVVVDDSIKIESNYKKNINITTNINKNPFKDDNISITCSKDIQLEDYNSSEGKGSPSISIRSNNISIVSLEGDIDSSVVDSDSDFEDIPRKEYFIQKLGQQTNDPKNGVIVINEQKNNDPSCSSGSGLPVCEKPQIGSIAVQNSTDITFGNKTFYQGPVTIKQFLLENKKWRRRENGNDNPSFEGDDNRTEIESNEINRQLEQNIIRKWLKKTGLDSKVAAATCVIILVTVVIGAITLTTIALTKASTYSDYPGGGKVLRLISRAEWIAQPPNNELTPLVLPSTRVIITHTATENCTTQASCTFRVRFIQTFHMESRNFDDIGYNFLVGGDGSIYEGRGWDKQGAHTKGFNVKSIGIAFIGTFTKYEPPVRQLRATQLLIQEGVRIKKLAADYKLFGHRQLIPSESPGEALYKIIRTWPHWSDEISLED